MLETTCDVDLSLIVTAFRVYGIELSCQVFDSEFYLFS